MGHQLWVDHIFSSSVLNGTDSFHASATAYAEFWSDNFWATQESSSRKITCCHIWHTFVQESIRHVASATEHTLNLDEGLTIDQVTKKAFSILGEEEIVRSANQHSCSECTYTFKKTADRTLGDDPAALLGQDENHIVPALEGDNAVLAVQDAVQAKFNV